jgi:hypothetical protein
MKKRMSMVDNRFSIGQSATISFEFKGEKKKKKKRYEQRKEK